MNAYSLVFLALISTAPAAHASRVAVSVRADVSSDASGALFIQNPRLRFPDQSEKKIVSSDANSLVVCQFFGNLGVSSSKGDALSSSEELSTLSISRGGKIVGRDVNDTNAIKSVTCAPKI